MITDFIEWGAANQTAYIAVLSAIGLSLGVLIVIVKRRFIG